jgi:hypothetical protein
VIGNRQLAKSNVAYDIKIAPRGGAIFMYIENGKMTYVAAQTNF